MATDTKKLNEMSLTDLVLPQTALENIIEVEELDEKLSEYVKTEQFDNAIADVQTSLENYATVSRANDLEDRIAALERTVEQLAAQLQPQDGGQTGEGEQTTDQTTPETPPEDDTPMTFTSIKSETAEDGFVRKGEQITIDGSNLLDINDPARYGLSVATFRQPSGIDAAVPPQMAFVEVTGWPTDNEENSGQTDFTADQIIIPATIWDNELNTEAVNDSLHDSLAVMLKKFKNDEEVDSADISATIAPTTQPLTATRRRKAK